MTSARPLPREFFRRDARAVAPDLLNKLLRHGRCSGRIVEVEAYLHAVDPASHSYKGRTARNSTMFDRPGLLYVYFTYGMHWCANVVCGDEGEGSAVLIRALAPVSGLSEMRERRGAREDRHLCSGPAKLCQALGIDGGLDGADLVTGDQGVRLLNDGLEPPRRPGRSSRIGISAGTEHPWRWFVPGDANLSR